MDVQRDSFYAVVRAWANDGGSRLIHCAHVLTWEDVQNIQRLFGVHHSLCFVDCGYSTYEVYTHCSENGWTALIGDRRNTFTHRPTGSSKPVERFYSPRRKINQGMGPGGMRSCNMHFWSNLNIKDCLARLRSSKDGATWEIPRDVPQDYLDMLDSERRVFERGKWVWKQIQNRPNHFFDCEAMQVCAATMLKLVGREAEGGSAPGTPNDSPKGDSLNAARV